MSIGNEVIDPPLELPAGSAWKEQAAFLEHRAHLVFQIASDTHQSGSTHEDGSRGLAFLALDGNLSIPADRSEEHTSELQSLMRISYAVFCLKKKINTINHRAHPVYHTLQQQ